jgi:hypothetical protein
MFEIPSWPIIIPENKLVYLHYPISTIPNDALYDGRTAGSLSAAICMGAFNLKGSEAPCTES